MHPFTKVVEVRWSDIDANQHMRHNAYADLCTHTRMEWLAAAGFGMEAFMAHGFGPVLFRESTEIPPRGAPGRAYHHRCADCSRQPG